MTLKILKEVVKKPTPSKNYLSRQFIFCNISCFHVKVRALASGHHLAFDHHFVLPLRANNALLPLFTWNCKPPKFFSCYPNVQVDSAVKTLMWSFQFKVWIKSFECQRTESTAIFEWAIDLARLRWNPGNAFQAQRLEGDYRSSLRREAPERPGI